jgi:transposase-like protein
MDREWLAEQLAAGRSIEAIAREVGKNPSTVAYWMNKHGLVSAHAAKQRPRGTVPEAQLRTLVEAGLSVREIAQELERSPTAVRHWLRRYDLKTQPARYVAAGAKPEAVLRECLAHGWTAHRPDAKGHFRCAQCNVERVTSRRRAVKELLIGEAGGSCVICGYDRCAGALQFHHVDPATKRFEIGGRGLTRSLAALREEAKKCVLLCGNCHVEVAAGVANLPPA